MQVNIIPVIFAQYFLVISFIFGPVGSRHTFWYQKILQAGILSRLNFFPIISYFAMLTICLCISKMLCVTFTESTTNVSVIVKLPIQIVHVNMYITIFFHIFTKACSPAYNYRKFKCQGQVYTREFSISILYINNFELKECNIEGMITHGTISLNISEDNSGSIPS